MKSEQINELAAALSKAQGDFKSPTKNKEVIVKTNGGNSYAFEYADLTQIIECIKEPMTKNGLSFTHITETNETGFWLRTFLMHSSGQFISTIYPLPQTMNAKELGGAITYGKRYSLSALVGISADDDADAEPENVQSFKNRQVASKPVAASIPKPNYEEAKKAGPSAPQIKRLFALTSHHQTDPGDVKIYMKKHFNIESTNDLTPEQYDQVCNAIEIGVVRMEGKGVKKDIEVKKENA